MYRQSPSRNQRSKGIKVKNVLQICLLLAVCFWLLYQVKHSHDKKKEFDETAAKASLQSTSSDELIRFGRKDIRSRVDETDSKNEIRDETSEEEETTEEIEENKHGEDDPEDKKDEEREDDEAGGRDDEREEHEQEKSDVEIDRADSEEREDGEENETQETDSEDGQGQTEKESTVDGTDRDANDRSTHEAREEHYKADDASSAVTHDTHIVTENENEHVENSNEHPGNILQEETKENNSEETYDSENGKDLEVDGSEAARDDHQSNVITTAIKDDTLYKSENDSTPNNATTEESTDHLMSNSNTTEVTLENNDLPSDNATESKPELGHGEGNVTEGTSAEESDSKTVDLEQADNSMLNADSTHSDSNSTVSAETKDAGSLSEEFSDSSNNSTDSSALDNLRSEASNEEGNTIESSSENNNEFDGEKSDTSDGTDESLEATSTDNPEEVQEDAIDISDTSISMEEKDIRMDLDTLPEIQTEGTNSEDVAAE